MKACCRFQRRGQLLLLLLLVCAAVTVISGQDLALGEQTFADGLTRLLYDGSDGSNQCTSSLGISMVLSLLYPSMTGTSASQTAAALGFPTTTNYQSELVWNVTQTNLNARYDGSCQDLYNGQCFQDKPRLQLSNAVWVHDSGTPVKADYAALLGKDQLQVMDFTDANSGAQVNAWVNASTNGLIQSIVEDGPLAPLVLLAVNSIYLKASWLKPFETSLTSQDNFYRADGVTVARSDARFVHAVESYSYSQEVVPGYQIVQLPFNVGSLSMIFVLPTTTSSSLASSVDIVKALPTLTQQRVALGLPKFQYETLYKDNLKQSLQTLGMVAPFNGGLCIYENDGCSSAIAFVLQKTFFHLDELGIEAAAVSAAGAVTSLPIAQPVEMLLNRPFQFFVHDATSNLVLFEGKVVDPTTPDTAAALTTKHGATFWSTVFSVDPVVVPLTTGSTTTTTTAPVAATTGTVAPVSSAAPMSPVAAPVVTSTAAPVVTPAAVPTSSPSKAAPVVTPPTGAGQGVSLSPTPAMGNGGVIPTRRPVKDWRNWTNVPVAGSPVTNPPVLSQGSSMPFMSSQRPVMPGGNATTNSHDCQANPACAAAGLAGQCCPTLDNWTLACCGTATYQETCSMNSNCSVLGLTGNCCPTVDGKYLDCCDAMPNKCLPPDACPTYSAQLYRQEQIAAQSSAVAMRRSWSTELLSLLLVSSPLVTMVMAGAF